MGTQTIELLPIQAEFQQCDDPFCGLVGGFASGKTHSASHKFTDRWMRYPRGNHCIAGKDLPQLKRGTLITLKETLESRGISFKYNKTSGEITIRETGSSLILLSAENYMSWRALEADTIWADEISTWGPSAPEAFLEFLVPRRRLSPQGQKYDNLHAQLFFTTNPPTSRADWLYDLLVRQGFCKYWNMSTYDNYLLRDAEVYISSLKRAYSPDMWPILLGGQFGDATQGLVYKPFSRGLHDWRLAAAEWPAGLPPLVVKPTEPLCWALDFNVGLMCSVVSQPHTQRMVVDKTRVHEMYLPVVEMEAVQKRPVTTHQRVIWYILQEIRLPDAGTPDVLEAFLRQHGEHAKKTGVRLYGDASGGARAQVISAQSAARSNWQIIMDGLTRAGIPWEFRVPRANPSVMDRINATKAQLMSGEGIGMIIDGAHAEYLIQDYESVKFREGSNDIDKENPILTHLSDAIGYQIWLERELERGNGDVEFMRTELP